MIKKNIFLWVFLGLLLGTYTVFSQPLREADYSFQHCQYEKALDNYKKGIKKISKNQIEVKRVTFQIAECYRIMGDLKRAEQQYLRLEKRNYQKDNPMILFHLASIYNLRGEYDMALKYYTDYQKRVPDDSRIAKRLEGCEKAKMWTENPTRYEVENFKKLNTKQDEWAPRWGNPEKQNQIIFTSNREGSKGKGTDQWTGGAFSDIYQINKPKSKNTDWPGEWSPVLPLDEDDVLNTAVNEGEASANQKGGVVYFTKCPQDKKKVMGCYIYSANKRGKSFGEPEKLELGNDSLYNFVHPFISPNELVLYFASNMPGGYGGYDLYKATRAKKSGKFSNVENLGPKINTAGQEVFPSLRNDTMLYFSSDGHVGMGGLDLFVSVARNGSFQEPENLMVPINSCWDDLGIIFDENDAIDPLSKSTYMAKGFFSSNRPGGKGGDDIYYFVLRPLVYTLAGYVKDDATLQYIDGANVEISGSDGSSYKTQTDVKGYYFFDKTKILPNVTYTMKVTKSKYWEDRGNTATQTTVGLSENTDLKQDFKLTPIPKEPIILPEILYDLAKWDLKPQFEDSLLYLYHVMIKNPTLVVELRSHTDYRDNDENNEVLSQKRAQTAVDFLVNRKGIDPERIVPKGYGEYRPRKFEHDFTYTYKGTTVTFPKGTELTESYITSLSSKGEQEAANALNRRTEFIVLRTDFVPKSDTIGKAQTVSRPIAVIQQRSLPITLDGKTVKGNCQANSKSLEFEIAPGTGVIHINYTTATQFLKDMIITVNDFENKEKAILPEDGSIIENSILYLNELRVGDDYSENVKVVVKKNLKSPITIGERYIREEWGSYTIDETKKILIFDK
ncbi:MAG: OmpA family protein [Bacteroidales bacterium]|nr:OmpA family protein [Bacteroidales bacterium]